MGNNKYKILVVEDDGNIVSILQTVPQRSAVST